MIKWKNEHRRSTRVLVALSNCSEELGRLLEHIKLGINQTKLGFLEVLGFASILCEFSVQLVVFAYSLCVILLQKKEFCKLHPN